MDLRIKKKKQDKLRCRLSVPVKSPKTGIAGDSSDSRGIKTLLCPTSRTARTPQESSTKLRHLDPSTLPCLAAMETSEKSSHSPPWQC